jgi:alpha-glucosidase
MKIITLSNVLHTEFVPNGILYRTAEGSLQVRVFRQDVIEVRAMLFDDEGFETHSYGVQASPLDDKETRLWTIEGYDDYDIIMTNKIRLKVQKAPLRLAYYAQHDTDEHDSQDFLLNEDHPSFGITWQGTEVTNYKTLQPQERFIGLGEKTGGLDRRGNTYINWNSDAFAYGNDTDPLYGSYPFYVGILPKNEGMYGIFFDNTHRTNFNFGASTDRFSYFQAQDGEMRYYFIHNDSLPAILEAYTWLTGRIQMPPLWSLGYQQCRYSYYPDKEILRLAETFREKDIPADVLYFDIHYMEKYKVFTWDKDRFPAPAELISKLKELGFEVVLIFDPGVKVEKDYLAYEDGLKEDIFVKYADGVPYIGEVWPGRCHFPDFTAGKAREWWGKQFEEVISQGVEGYWNDMNEPAVWGKHFPDITLFDYEGENVTHKKAHNAYGMQMARATFEGTKARLNGKRPFVLTRAGYSGVQRYAAVWTGDNCSDANNMMGDIRLLNNMGLGGLAFCGYDVGGFVGEASADLFKRWIAIGAFAPFFRTHTMINSKDCEPWSFGEETEEIARNFIKLRYRLMPYLYSTFYEATQTGLPVQRSLAFHYPFDSKIYEGNYTTQYEFGKFLLVVPVAGGGTVLHKAYLPEGEWYDFYNDTRYEGAKEYYLETSNDKLPVFVKAGAILPAQHAVKNTKQSSDGVLELHVYNGNTEQYFVYYEDDGSTYAFEQGAYYKRNFTFKIGKTGKKKIKVSEVAGSYASKFTALKIYLHGFKKKELKPKVKIDNYRFVEPISNFDPWDKVQDLSKTIIDLPYLEMNLKNGAFEVELA